MRCCALLALVSIATLGTSTAKVDEGLSTTVTVGANAYDTRTSSAGCTPSGCTPANTRDGRTGSNYRWSCKKDLAGENCKITYYFGKSQDLAKIRIAFHEGDQNQRLLKIRLNGMDYRTIRSSGTTLNYQDFTLNSANEISTLSLEAVNLDGDEWIGITEVQYWVDPGPF